jgi:hypothetical protein
LASDAIEAPESRIEQLHQSTYFSGETMKGLAEVENAKDAGDKKASEPSSASKSLNKDAEMKTKTPTKHVKRSNLFGGIFG